MSAYTMDEVSKHTSKTDCWVILNDTVLDVTTFLKDHPGGELAILTFAGRDATEEFNMIHPPDVIDKYLDPKAKLGHIGEAAVAAGAAPGASAAAGKKKVVPWYKSCSKTVYAVATVGLYGSAAVA